MIVFFAILLIAIVSLIINYVLYQSNEVLKSRIGTEYQLTVRETLFYVDEGTFDFWEKELKKERSEAQLERYIARLRTLSNQYHRMNGRVSILGTQLDIISDQLVELKHSIDQGIGTENQKNVINNRVYFIHEVLKPLEKSLNENPRLWFNELSNYESNTSTEIWGQFKKFEKLGFLTEFNIY